MSFPRSSSWFLVFKIKRVEVDKVEYEEESWNFCNNEYKYSQQSYIYSTHFSLYYYVFR